MKAFEVRLIPRVDHGNNKMILGMDFLNRLDFAFLVGSNRSAMILSNEHPIPENAMKAATL